MMHRFDPADQAFECVEPALGDQLWQLADPAVDADLRLRLMGHLTICDACRLTRQLEGRIEYEIRAGATPLAAPRRLARWATRGGAMALAAALALMFLLPPRPHGPDVLRRGPADPQVLRPVEGEVVLTTRPVLSWSAIEGATSYRIDLSSMDSAYTWSGRSVEPHVVLPADAALPLPGRYRFIVTPVPPDLAQAGDMSVSFEQAGLRRYLAYRVGAAPGWARALGILGAIAAMGGAVSGLLPRRV